MADGHPGDMKLRLLQQLVKGKGQRALAFFNGRQAKAVIEMHAEQFVAIGTDKIVRITAGGRDLLKRYRLLGGMLVAASLLTTFICWRCLVVSYWVWPI